jgi:hypothetical protein
MITPYAASCPCFSWAWGAACSLSTLPHSIRRRNRAPRAQPIPAWGIAPGNRPRPHEGLKARPISCVEQRWRARGGLTLVLHEMTRLSGMAWCGLSALRIGRLVSWGDAPGWYRSRPWRTRPPANLHRDTACERSGSDVRASIWVCLWGHCCSRFQTSNFKLQTSSRFAL